MPVAPSIYDLANLQQITHAGQPLLDYLENNRRVSETQRQEEARLNAELTLQGAHNVFTGQQRELDRANAIKVVQAQEKARMSALRAAATSRLEARYPRKAGESDDDYMERIGKIQAIGPNKAYKQMRSTLSGAETRGQELEAEIQQAMAGEERRRRPFVEAKARQDADLLAAFSAAGSKTVPANVSKAIEALRREKGGEAKAELLDSAWQAALASADDPKKVPYSVELGDKIKGLRNKISSVNMDAQRDAALLSQQAKILIDDPNFIGGPHLDFGMDAVGATPVGGGGGGGAGVKLPANAAGRTAVLQSYTPTAPGPLPGLGAPWSRPGLAPPRDVGQVPPLLKGPDAAPVNAFGVPTFSGVGSGVGEMVKSIPMNPYGGLASPSLPTGPSINRFMGMLGAGAGGDAQTIHPQTAQMIRLFGNDAPSLLAPGGPANKLASSTGMSEEEQRARFARALAGDPKEIEGIKRVLNYVRAERDNPTEPFFSPANAAPYTETTPMPEDFLLPQ